MTLQLPPWCQDIHDRELRVETIRMHAAVVRTLVDRLDVAMTREPTCPVSGQLVDEMMRLSRRLVDMAGELASTIEDR